MENKRVLILHGWGGSDYPHWQAWLAKKLYEQGCKVSFPTLPNKDLPKVNDWVEFAKNEVEQFNPNIVVCHSMGNILWFNVLNSMNIKELDKLLLVAPVRKNCDIEELKEFFPYCVPQDLKAKESLLIVSTNDEYMNINEAKNLQNELNIDMEILKDAGHINDKSGFGEFSQAFDWIVK